MTKQTKSKIETLFRCQDCGKAYRTIKSAERASSKGCTKCGGVDIDIEVSSTEIGDAPR